MKVKDVIPGYVNNVSLKLYILKGADRLFEHGYKRFTAGMAMVLKAGFKMGKSLEDSVADVMDVTNISDCTSKDPTFFAGNVRHMIDETLEIKNAPADETPKASTEESEQPVDPGAALFDAYATAKKNLTDKLKSVLQILVACNALEVEQGDSNYNASYIGKNINAIATHQWKYCAGHEKIYCQHTYFSQSTHSVKFLMVKVPVKYLGMTDDEIWEDNKDIALKALNEKKASLERKRAAVLRPVDEKITAVKEQIRQITEHNAEELLKKEDK